MSKANRKTTTRKVRTQKEPRLSRRELAKLAADLVTRLATHRGELEAIQRTHAPNRENIVAEYYARVSFGIAIDHQARSLRDIAGLAEIIHEQAARGL